MVQYEGINSLFFVCGRVEHKVEGCPYKIQQPVQSQKDAGMKKEAGMENQTAEEKTSEKAGPDETPFGPWVILACKRKSGNKGVKDIETLAQSGYVDHSPARPIRVSSPIMGFPTAGLDAVKNHQAPIAVQGHDVSRSEKISSHNID